MLPVRGGQTFALNLDDREKNDQNKFYIKRRRQLWIVDPVDQFCVFTEQPERVSRDSSDKRAARGLLTMYHFYGFVCREWRLVRTGLMISVTLC